MLMFAWRSQEQFWSFKRKMRDSQVGGWEAEQEAQEEIGDADEISIDKVYAALDDKYGGVTRKKPKKEKVIEKIKPGGGSVKRKQYAGKIPQGLPQNFYDENGEINLAKVSGAEAFKYFNTLGIPLPVIKKF
jgi:hypothetical protein